MGDERRQDAEARTFMNDPVQSVVRKTGVRTFLTTTLIQEVLHIQTEAPLRPEAGQLRTEYPASRAKAPSWCFRRPGRRVRQPDTTRRPQTFGAEEIGKRRIRPS